MIIKRNMWTDKLAAGCCRDSRQSHITKSCFHFHTLQKPAWDNPLRHFLMNMFILFYTFPLFLRLYWKVNIWYQVCIYRKWPRVGKLFALWSTSLWYEWRTWSNTAHLSDGKFHIVKINLIRGMQIKYCHLAKFYSAILHKTNV